MLFSWALALQLRRSAAAEKVMEMESQGATLDELLRVIAGQPGPLWDEGDRDAGLAAAGQSVDLIRDVPTVKGLTGRIMEEPIEARERLNGIVGAR